MESRAKQNNIVIEALANEACQALFDDYDLKIDEAHHCITSPAMLFCGIIGFTGDDVRGTLLLALGREAITATMPNGSPPGDTANRNWISELANQMLGRIKNMLLRRGSEIYLTMPLVLRGEHLSPLPRESCQGLCYKSDAGDIRLWLDAEFSEDFILPSQDTATLEDLPAEGETMLF